MDEREKGRAGSARQLSGESAPSKPDDPSLTPDPLVKGKKQLLKIVL